MGTPKKVLLSLGNPQVGLLRGQRWGPRRGLSRPIGRFRDLGFRIIGYILGLYWDNGKENGNYRSYRCYIGIIGYILGC